MYGIEVVSLNPLDSFMAQTIFSGAIAFILVLPIILYHVYKYVQPEGTVKKIMLKLFLSWIIALAGFTIGITYFSKLMLGGLSTTSIVPIMWSIRSVLGFTLFIGVAIALALQMILIIPELSRYRIVDLDIIRKHRMITLIVLFIISAIATPTGDMFSQTMIVIPLWLSIEIGLLFSKKHTEMI